MGCPLTEITEDARPYSVSVAMATASASVLNAKTGATGANTSSRALRIAEVKH
jgi:hypothetical protein